MASVLIVLNSIPKEDVKIVSDDLHFAYTNMEIQQKLDGDERAVIVLFKDTEQLMEVYNSDEFALYKERTAMLTPESAGNFDNRDAIVSATATQGRITLVTKISAVVLIMFPMLKELNKAGGLHVISTFVPPTESDQKQYEGRTARQGANGSFSMVVSKKELKDTYKFKDSDLKHIDKEYPDHPEVAFDEIVKAESKLDNEEFKEAMKDAAEVQQEHDKTEAFIKDLQSNNKDKGIIFTRTKQMSCATFPSNDTRCHYVRCYRVYEKFINCVKRYY